MRSTEALAAARQGQAAGTEKAGNGTAFSLSLDSAIPEEAEMVAYLAADSALMAILGGGIYAATALSRLGIQRDATPAAFAPDGFVLPLLVVKARAPVPDRRIFDEMEQLVAITQVMECWLYQAVGYGKIHAAMEELYRLLQGHSFPGTYPLQWSYTTGQMVDEGSLKGNSMQRMEWRARRLRKPA